MVRKEKIEKYNIINSDENEKIKRMEDVSKTIKSYYPSESIPTPIRNIEKKIYTNKERTIAVVPKSEEIRDLIANETDFILVNDKQEETIQFVWDAVKYGVSPTYKKMYGKENLSDTVRKNKGIKSAYDEYHMDFSAITTMNTLTDIFLIYEIFGGKVEINGSSRLPICFTNLFMNVMVAPIFKCTSTDFKK